MDKLLFILMLAPWVYAIGLLMYFVILFNQKKKLPWGLAAADLVFVGLFLYLHNLLYQEKLAFVGSYVKQKAEFDMATEIANVETTCANVGLGIAAFAIVQFLFMKSINKQISKLNDPPPVPYHKTGSIIK
jgi:hypothetical protein